MSSASRRSARLRPGGASCSGIGSSRLLRGHRDQSDLAGNAVAARPRQRCRGLAACGAELQPVADAESCRAAGRIPRDREHRLASTATAAGRERWRGACSRGREPYHNTEPTWRAARRAAPTTRPPRFREGSELPNDQDHPHRQGTFLQVQLILRLGDGCLKAIYNLL
jgi:hypothetical protein